jgi:hypothetical protein
VPIAAYRPRFVPDGWGPNRWVHAAAPHHLTGLSPPAMAVLEIGATVAVPIVSAAAASAIASNVFMSGFEVIVEQEFEDPRGGDFEAEEIVVGGQYEFVERHGDGIGLAFRTLYEFALLGGEPDEILFGPLGKWVNGPDSFTVNTFFIGQVGNDVEIDSLELQVFWRLKHELNERWALGVESFSEIEDLSNAGSFDDQLVC